MTKEKHSFLSVDGKTHIYVSEWKPDEATYEKPLAILQICHGMIEYIDRYDGFAEYLANRGILVVGNDHLGHGHSVTDEENLGFICADKPESAMVTDAYHLTCIMKKKYPDVPYVLMGHSMGSFVVRRYICDYGESIDAVIVMGTGHQADVMVNSGLAMVNLFGKMYGDRHKSSLLAKIMFGSYNKRIADVRTANDWLTRDAEVVDAYNANKWNTFLFTINGYKALLGMIKYGRNPKNMARIPHKLPMLMLSGKEDPVGEYGEAVVKAYGIYHDLLDEVDLRLYDDCRHELCNELNKLDIYQEIYEWIVQHTN